MGKTYLAIIGLLVVLFLGAFLIKNQPGDIKPEVLPSTSPKVNNLEIFAQNLGGVRDLEFSSGGTLIASITSDGKIMALKNGEVIEVLTGLNKPHGIAFFNSKLF
ncbi:hypothetical protein HYU94_02795, partial [Candidatus Daviesbacteria bacterium]|nr:hypothetical protein [Candidatus Daviesbacteria bacterium]